VALIGGSVRNGYALTFDFKFPLVMSKYRISKVHLITKLLVALFVLVELVIAANGGGRGFMVPSGLSLIQTLACFPGGILGFIFYPSSVTGYLAFYIVCGLNFVGINRVVMGIRSATKSQ